MCVAATGLWGLSLALWLASYIAGDQGIGQLAIIIMGAAATMTVRAFFVELNRKVKTAVTLNRQAAATPVRSLR